ncbi:MAG: sigma-54 dependent transcriptional regulator [Calditrichia bacterium]
MKFNILIVDDEPTVAKSLKRILESKEHDIDISHSMPHAEELAKQKKYDLLIVDYNLGPVNGLQVYHSLKEIHHGLLMIMITAYGNIELAVQAMKEGAYDFIEKNQPSEVIAYTVQRALDSIRLKKEVEELKSSFIHNSKVSSIIHHSPAMETVFEMADKFARTDSTVLLTGETGTGKNLVAEYIHLQSARFNKPFVVLNCCAIPSTLIESELFGYDKGAFTGAQQNGKPGFMEKAHEGTLFLDEIGEFNLDLQGKLLHIMENREYFRIGSIVPQKADIRIIAATNVNLQKMVDEKTFRPDLFYRLNVATIHIPPLRDRKEDIIPLAKFFIEEYNKKFKKSVSDISSEAENYLMNAPWVGNVRELKHLIERIMILIDDEKITLNHILKTQSPYSIGGENSTNGFFSISISPSEGQNLLHVANKKIIEEALKKTDYNISKTARLLGVPRTTLNFYISKFSIELP